MKYLYLAIAIMWGGLGFSNLLFCWMYHVPNKFDTPMFTIGILSYGIYHVMERQEQ